MNNVAMYEAQHSHFQTKQLLLVNMANQCDQLEPTAESAWRNLLPNRIDFLMKCDCTCEVRRKYDAPVCSAFCSTEPFEGSKMLEMGGCLFLRLRSLIISF